MAAEKTLRERKRRLVLSLDASRAGLLTSGRNLRRRIHPGHALIRSFRHHPMRSFAVTAGGVALLTFFLKRRRREPTSPKSLLRRLRSLLFTIAKPALALWLRNQAKAYLQSSLEPSFKDSLLGP